MGDRGNIAIKYSNEKKESALKRVQRRRDKLLHNYAKLERLILEQNWTGGEEDRIWLEQYAIGVGMDICCGDFVIGENSIGIDYDYEKIGADRHLVGDEITDEDPESMDYIITNYLDAFSDTFKVLRNWFSLLKKDGTLAFTCRNADAFNDTEGPLHNRNRKSLYNPKIIGFYLNRLGFKVKIIELAEEGRSIRVMAKKG